jgi:hypothetical protein
MIASIARIEKQEHSTGQAVTVIPAILAIMAILAIQQNGSDQRLKLA